LLVVVEVGVVGRTGLVPEDGLMFVVGRVEVFVAGTTLWCPPTVEAG
jgi:hypothetical protein